MFFPNHIVSLLSPLLLIVLVIAASAEHHQQDRNQQRDSCPGLTPSPDNTKWWRTEIEHNGTTPYSHDSTYKYYRNVIEYGADPSGVKDSSDAFNDAITCELTPVPNPLQSSTSPTNNPQAPSRTPHATTQPSYIYIPPGTYLLKTPISLLLSTHLIGDPLHPPKLLAHPSLLSSGAVVINAHLAHLEPNAATKTFYVAVRNLVIDTTGIDRGKRVVGVDWSVSQGCSLANVRFVMPGGGEGEDGNKHVGIAMGQVGSGVLVGDCVSFVLERYLFVLMMANSDTLDIHWWRDRHPSPEPELPVQGARV